MTQQYHWQRVESGFYRLRDTTWEIREEGDDDEPWIIDHVGVDLDVERFHTLSEAKDWVLLEVERLTDHPAHTCPHSCLLCNGPMEYVGEHETLGHEYHCPACYLNGNVHFSAGCCDLRPEFVNSP